METEWWQARRDELLAMADQGSPRYVLNEETLNEILFDLLSIDVMDRLFYPVHANPHPKILRKAVEQGIGFRCISCDEMDGLLRDFHDLDPGCILFFPVAAPSRDFARAFDCGAQVVVYDPSTIERWPDFFQDRRFFIPWDAGAHHREIGFTGTSIKGLYCPLKRDGASVSGPDEMRPFLTETLARFPDKPTLILGNGMEQEMDREQGWVDVPALSEYLETFAQACPPFKLWLELPHGMLARAGVLITRTIETGEQEGTRCVKVNADMQSQPYDGRRGISHKLVNLSRPDSGKTDRTTRIIGQAGGGPGNLIDLQGAPAVIQEGDVLVFTNMGATGAGVSPGDECWKGVPQDYLHARSLCPVDIHEKQRMKHTEKQDNSSGRRAHE